MMQLNFKEWLNEASPTFKSQPVRPPAMRDIRIQHGPGSKFHQTIPTLPKRLGSDIITGHGASMQYVMNKYGGAPDDQSGYRDYFGDAFEFQEQDGYLHFYLKYNVDLTDQTAITEAVARAKRHILNDEKAMQIIRSRNADALSPLEDYFQDDDGTLVVDIHFRLNQRTTDRLKTKKVS